MTATHELIASLRVSKTDIANLALVCRPVVSIWISRYRRSDGPFPVAVAERPGQELFNAAEVVTWIEARGLGNNPSLQKEVALYAAVAEMEQLEPQQTLDGLTALLCTKQLLGEQLMDIDDDELLDRVESLDPDDEFLFAEVEALGKGRKRLSLYVDLISDAAFTPADAFEALMRQRFRLRLAELVHSSLADIALDLVSRLAIALVDPDEAEATAFVDAGTDCGDLLVALGSLLQETAEPELTTGMSGHASSRLLQRRLATHGWRQHRDPDLGLDGEFSIEGPAVFLAQFPSPSTLAMTDAEIVEAIDNIIVQMGDQHRGVIIAPASALSDVPNSELDKVRGGALRSDKVRAVVRLPEGLLTTKVGSPMALWVLGPSGDDEQTHVAQRWMIVADLSSIELDEPVIDALITDVLASLHPRQLASAHAFRFGQIVNTAPLLTGRTSLMRPRATTQLTSPEAGATAVLRIRELTDRLNATHDRRSTEMKLPVEHRMPSGHRLVTVTELVAEKLLTLVPGNRIELEHILGDGDVEIVGPDELLNGHRRGPRTLDRLTFAANYPTGRYTEPGDIICCTSPGFAVRLDQLGTSVVAAPARVLRVKDPSRSGLVPELIAMHLAQSGYGQRIGRAIRSGVPVSQWTIPRIDPALVPEVTSTLRNVIKHRADAQQRVDEFDDLTRDLGKGLGQGYLTLANTYSTPTKDVLHG